LQEEEGYLWVQEGGCLREGGEGRRVVGELWVGLPDGRGYEKREGRLPYRGAGVGGWVLPEATYCILVYSLIWIGVVQELYGCLDGDEGPPLQQGMQLPQHKY
jgi:hypothetical protein